VLFKNVFVFKKVKLMVFVIFFDDFDVKKNLNKYILIYFQEKTTIKKYITCKIPNTH
jgi:hypothetical protein